MAAAVWKGFLTFGLVSTPIRLYTAARSSRIYLHQLHRECHTRIKQPLFCPTCNRIVDRSEVVKAYEYEPGQYVIVENEELKKITPASASNMDILAFVKESQIDPLYFDTSYFAVPEDAGRKAYQLLWQTLEDTKRVAIAKLMMHQREYTVFIRPHGQGLTLHTMYFANEIREVPGYGKTDSVKLKPQEVKLAEELVKSLSVDFKPQDYHDDYQTRLKELIDAKLKGKEVTVGTKPRLAPVIDMMAALKKSLAATKTGAKKGVHAVESPAQRKALRKVAS